MKLDILLLGTTHQNRVSFAKFHDIDNLIYELKLLEIHSKVYFELPEVSDKRQIILVYKFGESITKLSHENTSNMILMDVGLNEVEDQQYEKKFDFLGFVTLKNRISNTPYIYGKLPKTNTSNFNIRPGSNDKYWKISGDSKWNFYSMMSSYVKAFDTDFRVSEIEKKIFSKGTIKYSAQVKPFGFQKAMNKNKNA